MFRDRHTGELFLGRVGRMIAMADEASHLRGLPAGTAHCLLEEVVSYRARSLSSERARDLEEHLRSCAACRRLVRDATEVLERVHSTVRAASSRFGDIDQILAGLRRKVAQRSVRPSTKPRQPSQRFWLPIAGVAAVVVLIALFQLALVLVPRLWEGAHSRSAVAAPAAVGPNLGP
jgi:hypothetical protein